MIIASNVNKSFGPKAVIRDLSFGVTAGEVVGLLGPNGSGKTTMVRLLSGVLRPDSGQVSVDGRDPLAEGEAVRMATGVLTESADFYRNMSAFDNLRFFADLYGVLDGRRPSQLLDEFGLADDRHRSVGTFSTGMRKRLGLAKALLHEPSVLFLDEPTNGLDPDGTRMVLESIRQLNSRRPTTILICSHLLDQLETVCDRYVFIDDGRLIESGTLPELRARYQPELLVEIETDMQVEAAQALGYSVTAHEPEGVRRLLFTVDRREQVPELLKAVVEQAQVFGAKISEPDLEDLYFSIRTEKLG